jgi:cytoskeletal protein CcmA (bactofilin family)
MSSWKSWLPGHRPPALRSLIGEGTVLHGGLKFADGLRVDGEVHGDVIADDNGRSLLVLSDKAKVFGKVKASHVIIGGEVHGPVHCNELLELQPSARILGEVRYETLEMHAGARIEGELRPLRQNERPALKLAASNDI